MTFERCECGVFDCVKFIKVEEKGKKSWEKWGAAGRSWKGCQN